MRSPEMWSPRKELSELDTWDRSFKGFTFNTHGRAVECAVMPNQLAANSVRTYRLAPEGPNAARNKSLGQRIGLFAGTVVFLLVLQYKQFGDSWQTGSVVSVLPSLLVFLFVLGAIAFGAKKGLKRNQESWDSYELVIGEDFLIRRIKDFPELEIQRHEVTAIRESATGLRVETKLKGRARAGDDFNKAVVLATNL